MLGSPGKDRMPSLPPPFCPPEISAHLSLMALVWHWDLRFQPITLWLSMSCLHLFSDWTMNSERAGALVILSVSHPLAQPFTCSFPTQVTSWLVLWLDTDTSPSLQVQAS